MKIKFLALALFSIFSFTSIAQESKKKVKEVGITFYNLKQYGAIFKIGQEDRLWRFRVLSVYGNSIDFGNNLQNNGFNLNLSAGRERRKAVSDKLNFIYGMELTGGFRQSKTKRDTYKITQNGLFVGITGVIGFNYFLTDNIFVGGELLPIAQFTQNTYKDSRFNEDLNVNHQYRFGFSNNSVLLSAGIKF